VYEGISYIRDVSPDTPMGDPTAAYIVLGLSLMIEGGSFLVATKLFLRAKGDMGPWQYIQHSKDRAFTTVVLEDSAAMLGLIFAFLVSSSATSCTIRTSTVSHPSPSASSS